MKRLLLWLAGVAMVVLTHDARAFDACGSPLDDPEQFRRDLSDAAVARSPVRYHNMARSIRLITTGAGDALIPFALEQQQTRVIVFPALFARVACEIALAQYTSHEGVQPEAFGQAGQAAARCLDAGGLPKTCLVGFATELRRQYTGAFAALPAERHQVAFSLYRAMLNQILMHEHAHHFLGHFQRIATQKVSRIDAEFEADLFAITNGVQAGEPVTAMYYFFNGLAEMEGQAKKWAPQNYESAACRASNVENITSHLGIAPMMLTDAAFGGGAYFSRNSPSNVRTVLNERLAGAPPALEPQSCDRIAQVALGDARRELKQLYMRMDRDLEFLFAAPRTPDVARANRLLRDLSDMSKSFQHMNGIAAKSSALMLRRWGLAGHRLTPLVGEVERLLETQAVADNFLSEDFGRMLQAQGLAILQERVDLAPQLRLDQSFSLLQRAVTYNPAQSEAWMNLGLIAFKRGDCAAASRFGELAAQTHVAKETLESTQFFASKMKQLARDPETCRREGARFQPYPGM